MNSFQTLKHSKFIISAFLLLVVTYSNAQTISGESNPCVGDTETYSTVSEGSYSWNIPSGGQLVGGSLTSSFVRIKWTTVGSRGLSCRVQIYVDDPDCIGEVPLIIQPQSTDKQQNQQLIFPGEGCLENKILLKLVRVQGKSIIPIPNICHGGVARVSESSGVSAPDQCAGIVICKSGYVNRMSISMVADETISKKWQISTTNRFFGFTDITLNSTDYIYYPQNPFLIDTWFRVKLTKGCTTVYSDVFYVDVYDVSLSLPSLGSLGNDRQVCSGNTLSTPLSTTVASDYPYPSAIQIL